MVGSAHPLNNPTLSYLQVLATQPSRSFPASARPSAPGLPSPGAHQTLSPAGTRRASSLLSSGRVLSLPGWTANCLGQSPLLCLYQQTPHRPPVWALERRRQLHLLPGEKSSPPSPALNKDLFLFYHGETSLGWAKCPITRHEKE